MKNESESARTSRRISSGAVGEANGNKDTRRHEVPGESGRSLIEMLGILAVGAIMAVAAVRMYRNVRSRQQRFEAEQDLKALAGNARLLYSGRKNYAGISKGYLMKTGALKTEHILGMDFRLAASENGKTFSIIFNEVGESDCAYFSIRKFDWAESTAASCAAAPRKVEFVVK